MCFDVILYFLIKTVDCKFVADPGAAALSLGAGAMYHKQHSYVNPFFSWKDVILNRFAVGCFRAE